MEAQNIQLKHYNIKVIYKIYIFKLFTNLAILITVKIKKSNII